MGTVLSPIFREGYILISLKWNTPEFYKSGQVRLCRAGLWCYLNSHVTVIVVFLLFGRTYFYLSQNQLIMYSDEFVSIHDCSMQYPPCRLLS